MPCSLYASKVEPMGNYNARSGFFDWNESVLVTLSKREYGENLDGSLGMMIYLMILRDLECDLETVPGKSKVISS